MFEMNWATFHFLHPQWFLALIPASLFIFRLYQLKSKQNFWADKIDTHLLPHLLVTEHGKQSRAVLYLLPLTWLLAIVALANPVWEKSPVPNVRGESALIIALDLSRSMDADDVYPSRLAAVKKELLAQLKLKKTGSVGLVVFTEYAFMAAPLSLDRSTSLDIIQHAETRIMPTQGSRPDRALLKALALLKQDKQTQAQVLLITDGAYDAEALEQAAKKITDNKYLLTIVGVGSEAGGQIQPQKNRAAPLASDGRVVNVAFRNDQLKTIAHNRGAYYFHFTAAHQQPDTWMPTFKEKFDAPSAHKQKSTDRWLEYGPYLLFVLLPLASLAFRRGWIGLWCLAFVFSASTLTPSARLYAATAEQEHSVATLWRNLWVRPDYQAYLLFKQGQLKNAAEKFSDPNWKAAAWYRLGQFDKAAYYYGQMNTPEANFNRANALAQQGKLEEALDAYNKTLQMDIEFRDASYNRQLVEQHLKASKKNKEDASSKQQSQETIKPKTTRPLQKTKQKASKSKADTEQQKRSKKEEKRKKTGKKAKAESKEAGGGNEKTVTHSDSKKLQTNELTEKQLPSAGFEFKQKSSIGHAQWLNMINDNPSELLRLKFAFIRQHKNNKMQDGPEPW
jgi:Ca-activated chloride channel family protein